MNGDANHAEENNMANRVTYPIILGEYQITKTFQGYAVNLGKKFVTVCPSLDEAKRIVAIGCKPAGQYGIGVVK